MSDDALYVFLFSRYSQDPIAVETLAEALQPARLSAIPCDHPETRSLLRGKISSLPSLVRVLPDGSIELFDTAAIHAFLAKVSASVPPPSKKSGKSVMELAKDLERQRTQPSVQSEIVKSQTIG